MAYVAHIESKFENPIMLKKLTKSEKEHIRSMFQHAFSNKSFVLENTKENLKDLRGDYATFDEEEKEKMAKQLAKFLDIAPMDVVDKCINTEDTPNDITYCIVEDLERSHHDDFSFPVEGIMDLSMETLLNTKIRPSTAIEF